MSKKDYILTGIRFEYHKLVSNKSRLICNILIFILFLLFCVGVPYLLALRASTYDLDPSLYNRELIPELISLYENNLNYYSNRYNAFITGNNDEFTVLIDYETKEYLLGTLKYYEYVLEHKNLDFIEFNYLHYDGNIYRTYNLLDINKYRNFNMQCIYQSLVYALLPLFAIICSYNTLYVNRKSGFTSFYKTTYTKDESIIVGQVLFSLIEYLLMLLITFFVGFIFFNNSPVIMFNGEDVYFKSSLLIYFERFIQMSINDITLFFIIFSPLLIKNKRISNYTYILSNIVFFCLGVWLAIQVLNGSITTPSNRFPFFLKYMVSLGYEGRYFVQQDLLPIILNIVLIILFFCGIYFNSITCIINKKYLKNK